MSRKKSHFPRIAAACSALIAITCAGSAMAQNSSYYASGPDLHLFNPFPNDTGRYAGKAWLVRNLGPVGIGIDLVRPGMTMRIHNVEEGSPAAATGKLSKGQIIESINGTVLKDIDPRIILGNIVSEAEATDGKVALKIKGEGTVTVQIPVLGPYSPTWPLNCPKSDKIVRNLADLLAKQDEPRWGSVLFLLSTGEPQDLEVVRGWMKNIQTIGGMNWEKGYKGPGLCEYYLRTGDQSVLPVIQKMTEELRVNMYSGGWSGRGSPAAFTYSTGTGQVHASGVHCMSFLLMAKLCGVEVDQYMFNEAFRQFYRFAGHGNVAYGNGLPEGGFRDNGKTSGLAFGLGAAAMVDPQGEKSVFAKARDNSAMKAFYATNWFHAAHTGGGMGEIWHHTAINQMREKRPVQYRSYLDTRRWVMDLSRRFDGSIGIAGLDDRYDRSASDQNRSWGTYFALTYTLPRKTLQLFGAPRSKWAKTSPLPRPWGNAADDIFHSIEPIAGGPLTMQDLLAETVENGSSLPVLMRLSDPKVTNQTILKYIHHPEYGIRNVAMKVVVDHGRYELVMPLLRSPDPRLRHCGLWAITGTFKGRPIPSEQLTPEMFEQISKMVMNPDESWWVALYAIEALGRADKAFIGQHRDRLLEFLNTYNSPYLATAAATTLAKIATEPAHYEILLPALLKRTAAFRVDSASKQSAKAIAQALQSASPEVQQFADPLVKLAYKSVPRELVEPNTGAVMGRGAKTIRSRIGHIAKLVPGGEDYVKCLPKTTIESYISGNEADMYAYSGNFQPNPKLVGTWAWAVWPTPNNPGEIDSCINRFIKKHQGTPPAKINKPKDTLLLGNDGKVGKSKFFRDHFWSGDRLIGIDDDQALRMEVRTIAGRDFLIVEKGGFNATPDNEEDATATVPSDYHCGYHVYIKQ